MPEIAPKREARWRSTHDESMSGQSQRIIRHLIVTCVELGILYLLLVNIGFVADHVFGPVLRSIKFTVATPAAQPSKEGKSMTSPGAAPRRPSARPSRSAGLSAARAAD